jgi:predicted PurR-regulated permease PerM
VTERIEDSHNSVAIAAFSVALIVSIVLTAFLFSAFVTDFILACLFVTLLSPIHEKLNKRLSGRVRLSSVVVCLVLFFAIAVPATFVVTSLSVEVHEVYISNRSSVTMTRLQDILFGDSFIAKRASYLASLIGFDYSPKTVSTLLGKVIGSISAFLGQQVNGLLSDLVGLIFHIAIMILMVFYLLVDGERLKQFVFRLSPIPDEEEELISEKFKSVGQAILMGNGLGSVLQGVLGGIAMGVVGIPSPVLWGTVMTISAFLPLVGISIVSIPCTIFLALNGKFISAIVFFVLCTIMSLFVENVVKTKLMGAKMKMNNFIVFMSILGGLGTFGVLGLLYGPLVVTFFMTMAELYEQHYRPRIMRRFKRLTVS